MSDVAVCGVEFARCVCTLEPHGDDVAHVCGTPSASGATCGGSWFGDPDTDSLRIVSYPVVPLPPAYEAALGMVPLIVSVPAEEIDGLRPGNPVYDAMAEYARRERPGAGFMVVPQELIYDPIPIVQNLPEIPIDLVYDSISIHQNLSYSIIEAPCTVCGGDSCDMFFCYVTGK